MPAAMLTGSLLPSTGGGAAPPPAPSCARRTASFRPCACGAKTPWTRGKTAHHRGALDLGIHRPLELSLVSRLRFLGGLFQIDTVVQRQAHDPPPYSGETPQVRNSRSSRSTKPGTP